MCGRFINTYITIAGAIATSRHHCLPHKFHDPMPTDTPHPASNPHLPPACPTPRDSQPTHPLTTPHSSSPPPSPTPTPQVVARQDAVNSVSKTLDKADRRNDNLNAKVDDAADKAARAAAKAQDKGTIASMKKAAISQVNVEKTIRHVTKEQDQLADKVDRKINVRGEGGRGAGGGREGGLKRGPQREGGEVGVTGCRNRSRVRA